eukprot:2919730-Rhodomonas_salina.1
MIYPRRRSEVLLGWKGREQGRRTGEGELCCIEGEKEGAGERRREEEGLSLIHISEPTRPRLI